MKILDVPQSGSMAGTVSSRNRFGQYRRTRAIPVNPNSSRQGIVRSRLSDFSAAWRGLTEAQRLGWVGLADSVSLTNSLGASITLTGHQMFVRVNSTLANVGIAMVTDAPVEPSFLDQGTVNITMDASTHAATVAALTFPSDFLYVAEASPQRSAGRYFEGDYRYVSSGDAASFDGSNLGGLYEAKFGTMVAGKVVFWRIRLELDGFQDVGQILRVTIVP